MGMTLLYGFIIAIPAILVAGVVFSDYKKDGIDSVDYVSARLIPQENLPNAS
jgi:H+/gluconate symporter-like permease